MKTSPATLTWSFGDQSLTVLCDGYFEMECEQFLIDVDPNDARQVMRDAGRSPRLRIDVNVYLLTGPGHKPILFDTGMGPSQIPTLGRALNALNAAGFAAEDIGIIAMTHLHGDHCGGLIDASGQAVYPNAEVLLPRKEATYWLETDPTGFDPQEQWAFSMARNALAPYESRTRLIDEGVVAPGVTATLMAGHTPGHTGYRIATERGSILLWGDLLNVPHVQLARATASVTSDVDKRQASTTRQRVLRDAAAGGFLVAGAHTEFPSLFQTVFKEGVFSLRPAQWAEPIVGSSI